MKMRNKYFGSLIAGLIMVITACGSSDSSGTDSTEAPITPITPAMTGLDAWFESVRSAHEGEKVVLLMASHPGTTAFQSTISEFEAKTGVKVEFDVVEEGAMIEKQIAECGAKSDIYDIYMIAVEGITRMTQTECASQMNDWAAGTPDWYDFEDLMPAYRDLMTVNGSLQAVPFASETVFLMYRQDLFEKYGKTVPKTWNELRDLAKFFTESEEGVSGVSFRARQGWEFTYQYSAFMFPFGGQIVDGATSNECPKVKPSGCPPKIDVQGSVDALDYMISLKPFAPKGIEAFSFPEAWQSFQSGKAAMLVESSAAAGEIEDPAKSTVAGNVGYAVLPAGPAGAFTGVWGWGLGVNQNSKHKGAAEAVITWLTSRHNSKSNVQAGGIPGRESDFTDPDNQKTYVFYDAIGQALKQAADLSATGGAVVPKARVWVVWSDAIGLHGAEAFSGKISSKEAVKRMQADMEEAMKG